ncbi:hypothetical protein [Bradyrhizobium neotropicale]|uniref:hypothetical protein n=1 Tax=Bradyrhizobium neotropicale TaxID=1497615 RepID=UPI000ABA895C|nr:hypothetical protein [Bradyrhizobium neotropicale]
MAATVSPDVHSLLACARPSCRRHDNAHRTYPDPVEPKSFVIGEFIVAARRFKAACSSSRLSNLGRVEALPCMTGQD